MHPRPLCTPACAPRCEPWPSALAMAAELLRRPQLVSGKRVCELGCGLGLAGLAAAAAGAPSAGGRRGGGLCRGTLHVPSCGGTKVAGRRSGTGLVQSAKRPVHPAPLSPPTGAAEVVLLDREPLALQCALLNAALNGLPTAEPSAAAAAAAAADSGGSGAGVQPPSLEELLPHLQAADAQLLAEWQAQRQEARRPANSCGGSSSSSSGGSDGDDDSPSAARPGLVRVELFDWSQPVTLAPHDVMLVCDCLYESFSVEVGGPASRQGHGSRQPLLCRCTAAQPAWLTTGLRHLRGGRLPVHLMPAAIMHTVRLRRAGHFIAAGGSPRPLMGFPTPSTHPCPICTACGGGGAQAAVATRLCPAAAGRPARPRAPQPVGIPFLFCQGCALPCCSAAARLSATASVAILQDACGAGISGSGACSLFTACQERPAERCAHARRPHPREAWTSDGRLATSTAAAPWRAGSASWTFCARSAATSCWRRAARRGCPLGRHPRAPGATSPSCSCTCAAAGAATPWA